MPTNRQNLYVRGSSETAASLSKVSKVVDGKHIVNSVDFNVRYGETALISGPSGSGKSTCLRMLADLEYPTTGEVMVFGQLMNDLSPSQKERLIARRVSVATQDPALLKNRSVWSNFTSISEAIGFSGNKRQIAERAGYLVLKLGLTDLIDRRAGTLSGGEQCKVAIGRALVKKPDLLILDEPTHMVDPKGTSEVFERLSDMQSREGFSIAIVSHDLDQVLPFVDTHTIIDSGYTLSSTV